jgi:hypothetical protein
MLYTKLSTVVNAVRLRYAVPFVLLLVAIYWTGIHPWMANWGSTAAEQQMSLPGDELYPGRIGRTTWAITINAPPEIVWQWLVQVGQDRAGFYTYTWLENLTGCEFHNANEIHLEWQHLAAGDVWRLCQPDYLWGLGKDAVVPVLLSEPGHVLALQSLWGAHVILPIDKHTSRLLVRNAPGEANLVTKLLMDPIVFTMEKRMLLGLKARAEGRPDAPPALMGLAQVGWAAAGITVVVLFLSQRGRHWLVLPLVAALPALLTSSDVQAGLAAFLAVGMTALGFLIFGRNWWGSLLVIGSVVLLTLLLAPDAYVAFGLAFALLLLTALVTMVAAHQHPGQLALNLRSPAR